MAPVKPVKVVALAEGLFQLLLRFMLAEQLVICNYPESMPLDGPAVDINVEQMEGGRVTVL